MADLVLDLSTKELDSLAQEFEGFETEMIRSAQLLAGQTHLHILEEVQQRLHSRREKYVKALSKPTEVSPGVFMITLQEDAVWIEEGMCVVYGPAKRKQPTVLTPDGWVRVTDVRPDMLVLNQDGKWTRVVEILDRPMLDFCPEVIDEVLTRERFGYISGALSLRSKKNIVLRCTKCQCSRIITKFDWSRTKATYCGTCGTDQDLVTIETKVLGQARRLTITGGHPIATTRGWILARELTKVDRVLVPAWGACPVCAGPVPYGQDLSCSQTCGASRYQRALLTIGKHVSQRPDWLSTVYRKVLQRGRRMSGAEDAVAGVLRKGGQQVRFYGEDGKADWIRQFPVPSSIDRLGRQKYFFIDFYSPRFSLALEVDGARFHTHERDSRRDVLLLEQGIQTVRVPARYVRSSKFERDILPAILANHAGDIVFKDVPITDLKVRSWSRDLSLTRRWDIRVESGKSFVCQGILIHNSPHSMVKDLLGDNPKVAKDGSRYRVISFEHGSKGGTASTTPAEQELVSAIKTELKKLRVPWSTIERHKSGAPKTGTLHKIEMATPDRPRGAIPDHNVNKDPNFPDNQHGFGHGSPGRPMVGPTGIPFLKGLTIHQTALFKEDGTPKLDKKGRQMASRSITTYRVVSSKHEGTRWKYPGIEGTHFFDEALQWAEREWDSKMLPELLKKLGVE